MTKEEKELLLKDLSARLLYGVIMQVYFEDIAGSGYFDEKIESIDTDSYCPYVNDRWIENIKPYLRSMSSMTDDEAMEYLGMLNDIDKSGLMNQNFITKVVDWLDKKMFDHRGLIPKGLALEASEGMYNIKDK